MKSYPNIERVKLPCGKYRAYDSEGNRWLIEKNQCAGYRWCASRDSISYPRGFRAKTLEEVSTELMQY